MSRQTGLFLLLLILLFSSATLPACGLAQTFLASPSPAALAVDTTIYVVQPGDTLSQIAVKFHTTIEQLTTINVDQYPTLGRDPSLLQVGWRLRVPVSSSLNRATPALDVGLPQLDLNQAAQLIVEQVNTARAQRGLVLLRADVVLTRIANDRSTDMIARNYFSHYDPQTGQEPLLRNLQAAHYAYLYAGENIAEIKNDAGWVPPLLAVAARYNARDLAAEFVRGWLNSPEHRANILNAHYRRTGVALAVSPDGHRIVATQVFSD